MEKNNSVFIILMVIIISTILNILFIQNMKNRNDPKVRKLFQILVIVGVIAFFTVLIIWLLIV